MTPVTEKYVSFDRLDAAMSRLHADMERRFSEQTRWIVGWMTGLVASAAAIIIAVLQ
ncbi:MAG: hypothetical protein OXM57_10215 [bacterium]|nr:hypothetical protein [bacterium]MDE0353050.1 hypothetical protein [bacterium]